MCDIRIGRRWRQPHSTQMIPEPKIFYDTYLSSYHGTKATYLKHILENIEKFEAEFFKKELATDKKDDFRRTIKSDLRQTYFHAIESFFELFLSLNPKGKKVLDDENILFNLTNSNWKGNYKKIKEIAENEKALDFLDEEITVLDKKVSIGNYIFYMGLFNMDKHPGLKTQIDNSIDAIKYGVKIIARDFTNREEYNAYKHGLRIIPAVSEIMFADIETMETKFGWDLTDSMSFYTPTKNPDELTVVTKLFDSERDYQMTLFCSNLISHMIFYRKMSMNKEKEKGNGQIAVRFFGKEPIENCNKVNVEIQDLIHTVKRVSK